MRVLLIDVNCKKSSTGKIVDALFLGLKKNGHEATICYGRGDLINEDGVFKFGLDIETKFHAALSRLTGYNGYFSPLSTRRLIKYIDDYKPDLIHIHELHAYFVNIKPLVNHIKQRGIPVVWTFHCEYMYTGKCGHAYECLNFQNECGNCPMTKEYPKSLIFDKTKQMLKMKKELLLNWDFTIITPSKWLKSRVELSFLKEKKTNVIHNGIDTSIFYPRDTAKLKEQLGISKNQKVVLFVAPDVMSSRKGGNWVIKLAEKMKDKNTVFVMVGAGAPKSANFQNIIFTGPVYDSSLLAHYYSMADVFLLCSEKETYSMTCAEALCCGTPVTGFKCGAPETVFEEPHAKFVEYGDINKLADCIINQMIEDYDFDGVIKRLSLNEMVDRHIELYRQVI